ncbi:DUF4255 domain-containing protein [Streptomyces sp. NPDC057702]|uniref:DUF4255 domain-containing protein n=1 Tax=unclassified Streptomyces TaxID=2593676 RepID=UPI0036CCCF76
MIHEVDEALRRLLDESGLAASGVEVVFDAPTRDWAARRSAPTVCVFLYDIREDGARRSSGGGEEYDADGLVLAHRAPARWFELTYLVTAWASRSQDEHRLLAQVLETLVATDALPPSLLTGSLATLGLAVDLGLAGTGSDTPAASDVWSALGGELRPSLEVRVLAPLAGARRAAAPPVTAGLVVRPAPEPEAEAGAEGARRLRYTGVDDAAAEGFGAPRERRPAPERRRRRRGGRQP